VLQHLCKGASTQIDILIVFAVESSLLVEAPEIPERRRPANKNGAENNQTQQAYNAGLGTKSTK
jgi:hypothetical protein